MPWIGMLHNRVTCIDALLLSVAGFFPLNSFAVRPDVMFGTAA